MNYTVLHLHTDYSSATTNIDSVTKPLDYILKAKELGMKSLAFTEHGNILSWLKKKELCEKHGLKYIHGVEAYITETLEEKIKDNYHCCLYARNYEGVKELNKLISKSYNREDNHFYYVPRISIEELEQTSDNVIITSACLGGIFNKGNDDIKARYLHFFIQNKDRCYLEIQHHNVEKQKNLNKQLYKLSNEHNLKLIVGTDTHSLNEIHAKGRSILQKSKKIHFNDEEGRDLTFKSYDELIKLYEIQQSIPIGKVREALENTNQLSDNIEVFEVDREYKYPKLWNNSKELLKQKIEDGIVKRRLNEKGNFKNEYIPRIKEEIKTYEHNKAIDFLLLDEDIKSYARANGIYPGYSRGSVSGSLIAYIIGLTDMDSIQHKLNFQRFMNTERVSLADVDTDYDPNDRNIIKEYIYNKKGLHCADIVTFNTVALKGSIRDVCRAIYEKEDYLKIADYICKNVNDNEDKMRVEYPKLFEYVDIINGTIVSIGTHPCGVVVSPKTLEDNMGLLTLSTNEYPVTMLNMKEIDSQNYVKLDLLSLDNVTLINKTCELIGIERLTPDNVDDEDIDVWKSIRDDTLGIFQWEGTGEKYIKDLFSDETVQRIKRVNPSFRYMDLLSVGNGAIRPAGASYREELARGIFRDNGHEALNEMLAPTLGYLVYQEQIIEFLNKFCGYTMGEADLVRRGFAKKTGTEQHIPRIKKGFTQTMKEEYDVSEEKSEELIINFIKVIEDASDYLFSLNHSEAYSYIGYVCGYLRYYYPIEFLTVALNIYNGDMEKTKKIINYANDKNIKIQSPKFRYSKTEYFMDKKSNSIYKGIGSIKFISKDTGDILYNLKDNKYGHFIDLLIDINKQVNSRQMEILIKLDFFSEFGRSKKLLKTYEHFNNLYGKKQISKEKYPNLNEIFTKYALKESAKQFRFGEDFINALYEIEDNEPNEYIDFVERVKSSYEYIGSCDLKNRDMRGEFIVLDIDTKYTPRLTLYSCGTGGINDDIRVAKKIWKNNKVEKFSVIKMVDYEYKYKRKKVDDEWVQTDEKYINLTEYFEINN